MQPLKKVVIVNKLFNIAVNNFYAKKYARYGSFTLPETDLVQTQIGIPNQMATLYYAEHVHIAQTWTRIPTSNFCEG